MSSRAPRYRGILDKVVSGAITEAAARNERNAGEASSSDSPGPADEPQTPSPGAPARRESLVTAHGRVTAAATETLQSVRTAEIHVPDLFNRLARSFDPANPKFAELIESIRSSEGNVQPVVVRPLLEPIPGKRFELVAGERRMRACEALGMRVNAAVRELTDEQFVIARLAENTQRSDLSVWEKALMVRTLLDDAGEGRWARGSSQRIASAMGITSDYVTGLKRISAELPTELGDRHPDAQTMTFRDLDALSVLHLREKATFDARFAEMQSQDWSSPEDATRFLLGKELKVKKTRQRGQVSFTWKGESLQVELPKDNPELQAQFRRAFEKLVQKFS